MMESINNAIHMLLDNHISSITALFTIACTILLLVCNWFASNGIYNRSAAAIRVTTTISGLLTIAMTVTMMIFGYVAQGITLFSVTAGLVFGGLSPLKALRARSEGVEREELERRANDNRNDMLRMTCALALLAILLAPVIWRTADTPSMEQTVISSTSELNKVAHAGSFTFVWTPYSVNADGTLATYKHPTNRCNIYAFHHGQLIGTDVVYCDNCLDVFTEDIKIVSKVKDKVYLLAGNGMLYEYNPNFPECSGTTDCIRAIGDNILECSWLKGATRYNSSSKSIEKIEWTNAYEWTEATDDEDIAIDRRIHNFYSCQYM